MEKSNFICNPFGVCDDFDEMKSLCTFFYILICGIKESSLSDTMPKNFKTWIWFTSKWKHKSLWGLRLVQKWTQAVLVFVQNYLKLSSRVLKFLLHRKFLIKFGEQPLSPILWRSFNFQVVSYAFRTCSSVKVYHILKKHIKL